MSESARLLGISKAHLSNVENGYERISFELNKKLQNLYKPSEKEWLLYFISFTEDKENTDTSISLKNLEQNVNNTLNEDILLNFTDRKGVQVEFKWIPKKKKKTQHKLLLLNLK